MKKNRKKSAYGKRALERKPRRRKSPQKAGPSRKGSAPRSTGARRRAASVTATRKAGSRKRKTSLSVKKLARALLVVAGCLAAGAAAGAGAKTLWSWVTHSPAFAVKELVIRTGERVKRGEIKTLAGVTEGDNILSFRLADCVEAIEIHPWVKSASVMRELPDRVVIEVAEREPAAIIALGSLYYVDRDGEIFKKLLPYEAADYPVITGISLRAAVEEKKETERLIRLAIEIIELAKESRVMSQPAISEVHLDRTYGATVVRTGDGMRIRFGRGEYAGKFKMLERTLLELGSGSARVAELDLTYESRVTIRLREGYRVAAADAGGPGGL